MRHLLVRGYAVTHPPGAGTLPAAAGWDQLVYASAGVMRLTTPDGIWVVPPHRALWVPADTAYHVDMAGKVSLRILYFAADLAALPPDRCRAVEVPPLLRELIAYAHRLAPLDGRIPAHERLVGVLLDVLRPLPVAPLRLPMPTEPRAAAVARALAADPAATDSVAGLARRAGASRRTLERVFTAETGMSVGRWRQRLRLIEALRLLADGAAVTAVAAQVGYATPSAFGAAFVRELGVSPGRYFGGVRRTT
ncbi:MAG TPA: helix-turn-helix transcriptional regulator [Pilimelia sp.]|nr:helix-turn-helix transcriptional regulator [Pilimelia sp.]